MRITQVTYVVQIAGGPEHLDADQIAGHVAYVIANVLDEVAGIRFDEAHDMTDEEWENLQAQAIAEQRAIFV
jgi:hypothetical protein